MTVKRLASRKFKSAEDVNSPLFIAELNKLCGDYELYIFVTCSVLNAEVTAGLPWSTYPVYRPSFYIEQDIINIYIAHENFEKSGYLTKFYIKEQTVPIRFLEVFFMLLPKYNTIDTLKLEYCNLTGNAIEFLQTILTDFQNITDLSLDGNPNPRQNFAVVLENTNIKYLSLKRCKINELGLNNICKILWHSPSDKLMTLNLAGNYIDDNAAIYLAQLLRQNRNIRTINLADNWITDVGCCDIMRSLQNFALTHDEIVIKRKINMAYFMEKIELAKQFKKQEANLIASQLNSGSKVTVQNINDNRKNVLKTDSSNLRGSNNEFLRNNSSKKSLKENSTANLHIDEKQFIEDYITPRTHPFTTDIIEKDCEIYCSGNLQLSYINLSYNKITYLGYKFIIDALNYQLTNDNLGMGLVFIALDGNQDLTSPEFTEIYKILMDKKLKMLPNTASKSTILNRRSASKYSSMVTF